VTKKFAIAVLIGILAQPMLGLVPFGSQEAEACCNPIKWIKKKLKRSSNTTNVPLNQQELPIAPQQAQRESTALNAEYASSAAAIRSGSPVQYDHAFPARPNVQYESLPAQNATAESVAKQAKRTANNQYSSVGLVRKDAQGVAGAEVATMGTGARRGATAVVTGSTTGRVATGRKAGGGGRPANYVSLGPEPVAAQEAGIAGEAAAASSNLRKTNSPAAQEIRSIAATKH